MKSDFCPPNNCKTANEAHDNQFFIQYETIQYNTIFDLRRHNSLQDFQKGLGQGRSCTIQLLKVIDKPTESLDQGGAVDEVFFYFAQVFDYEPTKGKTRKLRCELNSIRMDQKFSHHKKAKGWSQ